MAGFLGESQELRIEGHRHEDACYLSASPHPWLTNLPAALVFGSDALRAALQNRSSPELAPVLGVLVAWLILFAGAGDQQAQFNLSSLIGNYAKPSNKKLSKRLYY